jgi:hypothetical protein
MQEEDPHIIVKNLELNNNPQGGGATVNLIMHLDPDATNLFLQQLFLTNNKSGTAFISTDPNWLEKIETDKIKEQKNA